MAAPKFYEGQEFHNPNDPGAPVLVYRGGKFLPKDASGNVAAPQGKVAAEDTAALKTLTEDAIQRQHLAARAQKFMDIQGKGDSATATGPIYGHLDVFGANINPMESIGKIFNPKLNQLDSVNNQTWPELRPTGSGPMRNTEVGGFKTAFPSTANWGTQNQDIAKRFADEAQEATRKAAFVSGFVRQGKGSAADALAAYAGGGTTAAPADPRATANAALKARSAAPKILEPADYLKPGGDE